MFTPASLTEEQRKKSERTIAASIGVLAEAGLSAEEQAACLASAAFHALIQRASPVEAAGWLRSIVDDMEQGVPRRQ